MNVRKNKETNISKKEQTNARKIEQKNLHKELANEYKETRKWNYNVIEQKNVLKNKRINEQTINSEYTKSKQIL